MQIPLLLITEYVTYWSVSVFLRKTAHCRVPCRLRILYRFIVRLLRAYPIKPYYPTVKPYA